MTLYENAKEGNSLNLMWILIKQQSFLASVYATF